MPRILLLDIETAPNLGYFWRIFKENIGINQILDSGYVLSWSAKWVGDSELMFDAIWKSGEKRMLRRIHSLLNEADIVVHYNGKSFDIPTLNKEFVKHHFNPPAPYKQVDLLEVVRDNFRFTSNKLDFVVQSLSLGAKVRHPGFTLWVRCMNGDPAARKQMERYNRRDVVILERLYKRLKPWIKGHPNVGAFEDKLVCPHCGSNHYQRRGVYINRVLKYARLQCQKCGAWFRSNKPLNSRYREKYVGIA